ncbi:MAG: flagellar basal body P-ring protein FlgI, partial [Armatimonadota bacterium]
MLALGILARCVGAAEIPVRLKDIARIEGARSNQLFGYGLVVGLDGTGD